MRSSSPARNLPSMERENVCSDAKGEIVRVPIWSPGTEPSKSLTGNYRPAANETALDLRRAVGTEVVHWLGAHKPAYKLDPGFLEHPRLSPRAVIGSGARFLDFLFTGIPRRRRNPGG